MSVVHERRSGRVRVYYANWMSAGVWKHRDAHRTVQHGLGEWIPIARANRPSLWADAGAGAANDGERILLLNRLPPSLEVARRMWRREQYRGHCRDVVATALSPRTLAEPAEVPRFARTGRPAECPPGRLCCDWTHT